MRGEVHIGGEGLARGYWRRGDLTALFIEGRGEADLFGSAIEADHFAEAIAELVPVRLSEVIHLVFAGVHAAGRYLVQQRVPEMGKGTEIIFVEGHSQDQTWSRIQETQAAHPERRIRALKQLSHGKGGAVREGFAAATGDVLFILDADLTMPPEELPKFYEVVRSGTAEFVKVDLDGSVERSRALAEVAAQVFGPIDVLVNNAGVYPPGGTLATDAETLEKPRDEEEDRRGDPDRRVARSHRDQQRPSAHQHDREHQRRFAPLLVGVGAHDPAADRPDEEAEREDARRLHQLRRLASFREEVLGEI